MIAVFCLGANAGPRVETVVTAARRVRETLGQHGLAWCSDLYADRHTTDPSGATVNLVLALPVGSSFDRGDAEAQLKQIEDSLGRIRDPEKKLPVAIDIDLVATMEDQIAFAPRYDPGCPYLFHGLAQLPSETIQRLLADVANERDFDPARNALGFYPLLSADYVQQAVGQ